MTQGPGDITTLGFFAKVPKFKNEQLSKTGTVLGSRGGWPGACLAWLLRMSKPGCPELLLAPAF